jgi:hypothetical protein
MISRNPKNRASSENAPGPRSATDAAMTTTKAKESFNVKGLAWAIGTNEFPIMIARIPTSAPAKGVSKPITSEIPAVIASDAARFGRRVGMGRQVHSGLG